MAATALLQVVFLAWVAVRVFRYRWRSTLPMMFPAWFGAQIAVALPIWYRVLR